RRPPIVNGDDVGKITARFVGRLERKFHGKPRSVTTGRVGVARGQRLGIVSDSRSSEGQTMTSGQPRHLVAWKWHERPPGCDQKDPSKYKAQDSCLSMIHLKSGAPLVRLVG